MSELLTTAQPSTAPAAAGDLGMLGGFRYPALLEARRTGAPMQYPLDGPVTLRWRS